MARKHQRDAEPRTTTRCAIYTRKSTEEGLEQEFNSLDAQREAGEAYVKSQAGEGWECLPTLYDDGGFTGANMDRPAIQRLLADMEAGLIDCVVVYKVDRLSRSLLDFARMMECFDKNRISFVSVTQQFNTANSMGRLMLNVLLSFAQFEREIISERTRDKVAAARRKGKWAGGHPVLGYDVDPKTLKLVVNEDEAARVRAVFQLYADHQALLPVVQELDRRGWANKQWTTRGGVERGGKPFMKTSLHKLLTNVVYAGKVRYKTEVHGGEQTAIVDAGLWQQVQTVLRRNGRSGGATVRNKYGALLKGLIHCAPCGHAMTPSQTTRKGNKRYRYYVCTNAQKRGWSQCPSRAIPAGEVERFVVAQLRCVGRDPAVLQATLEATQAASRERLTALRAEQRSVERDVARWYADINQVAAGVGAVDDKTPAVDWLADLQERVRRSENRLNEVRIEAAALQHSLIDADEVASALSAFDPVWESLPLREQVRLVHLLVERVDYNGATQQMSIAFHAAGIKALSEDARTQQQESIA